MALSSMMRQYLDIKQKHENEILMFRVGDFYEMFFDDAEKVSRELELTLTGKDCGLSERAPMCGVPYHAVDVYVARLIEKGYKVAICDQLTDPAESKGLVERDVTRIVTAGTLTSPDMLTDREPNYLLAVHIKGKDAAIAYCDVSTGEFYAGELRQWETTLADEVARISPKELIAQDNDAIREICRRQEIAFTPEEAKEGAQTAYGKLVKAQFGAEKAGKLPKAVSNAAGMLLAYLNETQKTALSHISEIGEYRINKFMVLDQSAITNLELVKTARGGTRKGSLLGVIDKTMSAMGARLLKNWIEQPLLDEDEINQRLDAVEYLTMDPILLEDLRNAFKAVTDIERLLSRIAISNVNPRDCLSLASTLKSVPGIKNLLSQAGGLLGEAAEALDPIEDISELIQNAISEDAPVLIKDGGIFKKGFNPKLDEYREASLDGKNWIARLEQREREETGIKNLKIAYNRLFGYYIEVTRSFYDLVPMRYVRKQTLANCERFTTQELKDLENTILGAQDNSVKLEYELFLAVREELKGRLERIRATANALKTIDCLQSLAKCALGGGYSRPAMNREGRYEIKNGRHPVVECAMARGEYVPNDLTLNAEGRVMIITGPNMAGKSTYMRQNALIVLLAQMGSFVPADSADISITDRIFTRIGANDDLYGGRSTFMVEMEEMSVILKHATSRSLVILDEVGRGTSTFDGLSIAWASVEYLASEKCMARTLFATHYHELSVLEGKLEGVVNYRVTATERGEDVIFLRKVVPGGEDKSYGIAVAKLAGLPKGIVARARQIMARLEVDDELNGSLGEKIIAKKRGADMQLSLDNLGPIELVDEIKTMDVMSMSPIDALNALYTLSEKARRL